MKLQLVNLAPLREESMQARKLANTYKLSQLQKMLDQRLGPDQESASNMSDFDPNEFSSSEDFGPSANDLERAITIKRGGDVPYDVAVGKMTQGEYDKHMSTVAPNKDAFNKSTKFDRMNEATEKSWNAIDVSRKAEKELNKELNGNKQWQERTAKKLAMLKKLNDDGKFKKKGGWDEEALQGWVDKDYSWETVSGKFANNLKEMYSSMYETMHQGDYSAIEKGWDGLDEDEQRDIINTALSGEARPDDFEKDFDQLKSEIPDFESGVANYLGIDEGEDLTFEPEDMDNPDEDLVIIGSGYLDIENKFGERPPMTNGEYAAKGQWVVDNLETITKGKQKNGDKEAALDYIYGEINEGSCGYSQDAPGGEELDTPGGTQGMDADKRTRDMMREVIRKEIKKLSEESDWDKSMGKVNNDISKKFYEKK